MELTRDERDGLHRIRRMRRLRWLLVPTPVLVAILTTSLTGSERAGGAAGLAVVLPMVFGFGGWSISGNPKCPRCGSHFEALRWASGVSGINPFSQKCPYCGLALHADAEQASRGTRQRGT